MADLVVVHAGNRVDDATRVKPRFPIEREGSVYRRLYLLMLDLQPAAVISAAAGGADLIMLRVAEDLAIPTHIALPLPIDEFRRRSVSDQGPKWVEAFERALDRSHRVVTTDLSEHNNWFSRGNEFILDVAAEVRAEQCADRVQAVVVTRRHRDDDSASADLAGKAEQRGWPVYVIDPLGDDTRPPAEAH